VALFGISNSDKIPHSLVSIAGSLASVVQGLLAVTFLPFLSEKKAVTHFVQRYTQSNTVFHGIPGFLATPATVFSVWRVICIVS
ncbi:hypothetical protein, partial [uncultured Meiothermus sp.]|uniref:hypothetical protein n=1 Tax=uncultured Meiothermus sp. TaxID=157471 RepID=UPI002606FBF0